MSSRERRNFDKQRKEHLPRLPPPDSAILKFLKRFWWLLGIIFALGGGYVTYTKIREDSKSTKQKYDEAKGPSGDLNMPLPKPLDSIGEISSHLISKPPVDTDITLPIRFRFAKNNEEVKGIHIPGLQKVTVFVYELFNRPIGISVRTLNLGLNIFDSGIHNRRDSFYIKSVNDMVYVSSTLVDLENGNAVATIDYNHWQVITAKSLKYYSTDTSLEVRDNRNEIILSLIYIKRTEIADDHGRLKIKGYFIDDKSIVVSGVPGIDMHDSILISNKDWKEKAKVEIQQIPTIVQTGPIQYRD